MLELLERAARREPQRQPALGHRGQRIGRTLPVVGDDLAAFERDRRTVGQGRGEEPGIEPARQGRRRHPARQRDQAIGPQPEVELGGHRGKRRRAREQGRAGSRHAVGPGARVRQQDAGLLEQLADRGHVRGERRLRLEVAAERIGGLDRRPHRARRERRVRVAGVDPAAGEDVHVRREGHGRRPVRQQRLQPGRPRTEQDDGRGRARNDRNDGRDRRVGHPRSAPASAAVSCSASAAGSVTGSRQAKSRQTYAVGRPSIARRSWRSGTGLADGSAAAAVTWFGR